MVEWWGEAPEWGNRLRRGMDFRYPFVCNTEALAEPDPARAMHTRVLTFVLEVRSHRRVVESSDFPEARG
jgi:hypothetical protein